MGLLLYPKLNTLSLWSARNTWKMRRVFSSSLPASSISQSKIDGGRSSFLTITTAISCVFVCTLAASAAHNEKKSRKKETFLALRLDRERAECTTRWLLPTSSPLPPPPPSRHDITSGESKVDGLLLYMQAKMAWCCHAALLYARIFPARTFFSLSFISRTGQHSTGWG